MNDSFTDFTFERYQKLIIQRTGIIFGDRRRNELKRHVLKTTKIFQLSDIDQLYLQLSANATDSPIWDFFIDTIIVGETYFFREKLLFQALREKILPEIIAHHEKDRSMRIWSAGCSTGEEPYSLAILLDQLLGEDIKNWHIFILATDINKPSLKKGIEGKYRSWSFRQTPKNIISTYFNKSNETYEIRKDIQKRVMFSNLNLNNPVYPSLATCTHAMDLILWRNVAIYFTENVIKDVLKRFYKSLSPLGFFNIGASESCHMESTPFISKAFQGAFIYQKGLPEISSQKPQPKQSLSLKTKSYSLNTSEEIKKSSFPTSQKFSSSKFSQPKLSQPKLSLPKLSLPKLSLIEQAEKYTKEQQFTEAIQAYQSHLSIYHNDAKTWYLLARVHANSGDLENAKKACINAIKNDPLIEEAYYIKGLINEEDGQLAEAIADYKKTLYLDPDFVLAHYHLSTVYQQIQDDTQADRHKNQAIRILSQRQPDDTVPGADELTAGQLLTLLKEMG
ncbi:chemotaxis protein methyltransferase CheR [Candidatus Magnetomorum sp. HK-1]|nr:chemotaxis protein methyltransferase CheR [Candidatus Magnetomorum sp. HK-1]